MKNLEYYESLRKVPKNAKKAIEGGRLKGMTNINPTWRIKVMTEHFGPCGVGWKYIIKNKWLEHGANDEVVAFVDIDLYIKTEGVWSEPIPGTGGAAFISKEKGGLYTSDECYKMALTDALSVACKALGVAADVYWEADATKYDLIDSDKPGTRPPPAEDEPVYCDGCGVRFGDYWDGVRLIKAQQLADRESERYGGRALCAKCGKAAQKAADGA